ncbi:penicillin acylase family protein [Solimonas fluminis]|uniref:Penicillin acylase family protein n=1 Tax=Solimonas fluminis TaxID=2086571 RepID=A0A2S5TET9_9GAMM|nr:penicillin acylase family protein [Solimonas fluminis]PPE73494.1 penicillin acylase family protein [Solimonas fluminis]
MLKRFLIGLLMLVLLLLAAAWLLLGGSLATLDGEDVLPGLVAPVHVEHDLMGIPTVQASNRLDLARATGYLHAQSRFFQMDLTRRAAAGELSALVGPAALPRDRAARIHRLRAVARQVAKDASDPERALLAAYAEGVNAGLSALSVRPFEYLLLMEPPRPWLPEDSILCVLAMWLMLTDEAAERDAMLHALHQALPPPLYAFITQSGTAWDAPLEGAAAAPELPIPGPEIYDLRGLKKTRFRRDDYRWSAGEGESAVGSNAWAVAGAHTADGGALVADDMHLNLPVPNTWYRMRLQLQGDRDLDVTGVSLPGAPFIVAGSNRHIAWGLTNSYGDWSDLVQLQPAPRDRSRYLTAEGYKPFELAAETIVVRGDHDVTFNIRSTIWGPVVGKDAAGRDLAVRWLGAQPGATNLRMAWLEQAQTVEEALAVVNGAGIPPQNFVVADRAGDIGWTIAGHLPLRNPLPPDAPPVGGYEQGGWSGWLTAADYPRLVNPPSGRIWTANQRLVDGEALQRIGDGGYDLGARALQIRGTLLALPEATPGDMLQIQLDDRALFLSRWQALLLRSLEGLEQAGQGDPAALAAVRDWGGHAATGSVGYRMVRQFHDTVSQRVFDALTAAVRKADPSFKRIYLRQFERPLLQIVEGDAPHLIDPQYASAEAFLQAVAAEVVADRSTWGERNTASIRHPLSQALPWLAPLLDMSRRPLPGDIDLPRVQSPAFGASERFAVSPGREEQGYFHMPGGQSGHPLSPFYRAGHEAWERGDAMPFLPGGPVHNLVLNPK